MFVLQARRKGVEHVKGRSTGVQGHPHPAKVCIPKGFLLISKA